MSPPGKSKITCYECNTCYSMDLTKIPRDVKSFRCHKCGKQVPVLARMLKRKEPEGPAGEIKKGESSPQASESSHSAAYYRDLLGTSSSNAEENQSGDWLATYADMMSILLIFFVLMFAISTIDKKKFEYVMGSINAALGGNIAFPEQVPPAEKADPTSVLDKLRHSVNNEANVLDGLRKQLERFISEENLQSRFALSDDEDGLVLIAQDIVMFDSGSAEIREEAKENLSKIGQMLRNSERHIIVEGHTDNVPIRRLKYSSNWELSVARATNVIHFLIDGCGFDPSRLSAAGYSYYRPRFDFSSAESEKNRRIEMVIKRKYGLDITDELLGSN